MGSFHPACISDAIPKRKERGKKKKEEEKKEEEEEEVEKITGVKVLVRKERR